MELNAVDVSRLVLACRSGIKNRDRLGVVLNGMSDYARAVGLAAVGLTPDTIPPGVTDRDLAADAGWIRDLAGLSAHAK
jgi:hypothetical protein